MAPDFVLIMTTRNQAELEKIARGLQTAHGNHVHVNGRCWKRRIFENAWAGVLPESCKEFWPMVNFSAREIEHGRFRALFADTFGLRWKMVGACPKAPKMNFRGWKRKRWRQQMKSSFTITGVG